MRYGYLVLFVALAAPADAAMLDEAAFAPARFLPPPPDEAVTKGELAELHAIADAASAERKARAARDARDERPDMFNGAIGFDIATAPVTQKLLQTVVDEEDVDSKAAKAVFHRLRPYSVDPTLKTCETPKPGKPANSYPSGHSTLGFAMGEVLAQVMPDKAPAILARAREFAENRLVCGVHYRSDIVAGQEFGTVLALRLMELPAFQAQMQAARQELSALARK